MQNFNIKEENNVSNFYIEKYTCDLTSWQKAPYQLISWWGYDYSLLLKLLPYGNTIRAA